MNPCHRGSCPRDRGARAAPRPRLQRLRVAQRPGAGDRDVVAANSGLDGAPGVSQHAFAIVPEICPTARWTHASHPTEAPMTIAASLVSASPVDVAEEFRTSLVRNSRWQTKGRTL